MPPTPLEFFSDLLTMSILMIPRLGGLIAPLFDPTVTGPLVGALNSFSG